jgi:hypothetical protein
MILNGITMIKRQLKPEYKLGLKYLEEEHGLTTIELSEKLGINRRNVTQYLKLWSEVGVKIIDWQPHKQGHAPVYGFGRAKNKPAPKTKLEVSRTYKEKFAAVIKLKKRIAYQNKVKSQ